MIHTGEYRHECDRMVSTWEPVTKWKKHTEISNCIWKKGYNRDKLYGRTNDGILEGTISELSPENYQRFSNRGKRNIFGQRAQCMQSHRKTKEPGAWKDSWQTDGSTGAQGKRWRGESGQEAGLCCCFLCHAKQCRYLLMADTEWAANFKGSVTERSVLEEYSESG